MVEIVFDKVWKEYGDAIVIENVSLTLKDHEFLSIVGPSGVGKTTLAHVLAKTLGRGISSADTYRPYRWSRGGREINMIFRDHYMSDLVGFVYSKMHAEDAANDFVSRIVENCRPLLASGRDALVPVILDGENAWEHYYLNGRPFLKALYRRISQQPGMQAVTVSEALKRVPDDPLAHISPGSWLHG